MEELFKVIHLNIEDKIGSLVYESHSKVKSTKYFPIYLIDGKKMIFKPLSRTKPYTTPLFAYSEVYWSYIINKYFDPKTPRYYLATSKGLEKEQPKYYEQGVLVESLTPNDEKLISLYDYFVEHPEASVNIKNYTNYCMVNYYYTMILSSNFISDNQEIGENLSYQILLSMLRQDQNYHFENINFIQEKGKLTIMPPIDFEFSTPFLYPEDQKKSRFEQLSYISGMEIFNKEGSYKFTGPNGLPYPLKANICYIVRLYPHIVLDFIKKLDKLIEDLPNIIINDPDNYIKPLNSRYWKVGYAYFKENDLEKTKKLKSSTKLIEIDKEYTFNKISSNILENSKQYSLALKIFLLAYYNGINDLENLTIKDLLIKLGITDDVTIEDIDLDTRKVKTKKLN